MEKPVSSSVGQGSLTAWPLNREPLRHPQPLRYDAHAENLYRTASHIFLALDYDGTLVPIASSPDAAQPSAELLSLLAPLAADPFFTVVVVSGRQLSDLCSLLPIPGISYIGTHGAELCTPDGAVRNLIPTGMLTMTMARLRRELDPLFAQVPGLVLENKRFALALHYRGARPEVEEWAIGQLVTAVQAHRKQGMALEVLHGKKVSEVRPIGLTKGNALRTVLVGLPPRTLPIYIGDDQTDEDAFQLLDRHGLTILVADHPRLTAAHYLLNHPRDVLRFLDVLRRSRGVPQKT